MGNSVTRMDRMSSLGDWRLCSITRESILFEFRKYQKTAQSPFLDTFMQIDEALKRLDMNTRKLPSSGDLMQFASRANLLTFHSSVTHIKNPFKPNVRIFDGMSWAELKCHGYSLGFLFVFKDSSLMLWRKRRIRRRYDDNIVA